MLKIKRSNNLILKGNRIHICYFSLAFEDSNPQVLSVENIKKHLDSVSLNIVSELKQIFPCEIPIDDEITNYSSFQDFSKEIYSTASFIIMNDDLYRFIVKKMKLKYDFKFIYMSRLSNIEYPIVNLVFEFDSNEEAKEFIETVNI